MKNENKGTALLILDVQAGILDRIEDKTAVLDRVHGIIHAAHNNDVQVIFVVVGFREGMPEIGDRNKMFAGIREMGDAAKGFID